MKVVLSFLLILLVALSSIAWGPKAHTEIGTRVLEDCSQEIKDNSKLFLLGNILPDMALSLKYYKGYTDGVWLERQYLLHSDEFLGTLTELCNTARERAFVAGWQAHLIADGVETEYSQRKMEEGAPVTADFPVDTFVSATQKVIIGDSIRDLIQEALGAEWQISVTEWDDIEAAFNTYFSPLGQWYLSEKYSDIADEWYSDYEEELRKSVRAISGEMFDPMVYDVDGSGVIEKDEALAAVADYFAGIITKAQVVEVLVLYFS